MQKPLLSIFIVLLSVSFFLQPEAFGNTFVVAVQNPAASDTNPGTPAKPLRSIGAAIAKIKSGDHVLIHGGDYRETVIIQKSGTAQKPIVIEAAPGEKPVIKGSIVIQHWTLTTNAKSGAKNLVNRDAKESAIWKAKLPAMSPPSSDGNTPQYWERPDVRQVFIRDGVLWDARPLARATKRSAMTPASFFCDVANRELFVWMPNSSDPNHVKVEGGVRGAWLIIKGNHITVSGIQMRQNNTSALANWPACMLIGDDIHLKNCTMTWGDFGGVSINGNHDSLSGCLIAMNGDSGIGGTGKNNLIKNCRVLFNNLDHYSTGWHAGGAKLIPRFCNSRIIGNEFAYNIGPGLWLDTDCNDNRIESNICHDNEGPGIMVEISTGNLVINNLCYGNRNLSGGEYQKPKFGAHNAILGYTPYSYRVKQQLPGIYHAGDGRGIYISSAPETKVLNNTTVGNEAEGICVEGPLRGNDSTRDVLIENNICAFNHGSQLTVRPNGSDKDTHGNFSDHNLLMAVGAILAKNGWAGASTLSLSDWQNASKMGTHSRTGDPLFVMPVAGDFRVQKLSPAAHLGIALPEVRADLLGAPRPAKGATSVGAFENPANHDLARPLLPASLQAPLRGRAGE